ncbi:hypothetical protein F511_09337 [Dorcoceras hygrometricum]|uniref:Uncharacterized protein n=1 Tax=Dorcoceras hygrometricum TaxID=472368 RepID=A0A2Z7BWB6_9LAMI|nr:hypothetical protein F511_09337 [Dorcoceras hygrometricum]
MGGVCWLSFGLPAVSFCVLAMSFELMIPYILRMFYRLESVFSGFVFGKLLLSVKVIQLVEEVTQLAVPQEVVECPSSMPPRRRGRRRGQFQESGGQNEDQYSAPSHNHESSEEGEAEAPPAPVERMDVVIARFQRMNPPVFNGDESSEDADSWLHNLSRLRVLSPLIIPSSNIEEGMRSRRTRRA